MLIGLWLEETVQFALENIKTSKETKEVYSTLQVSNTFYLIQFDHNIWCTFRKIVHVRLPGCWSMSETNLNHKFSSVVLFFHCILAYIIYKLGTFVYKLCCTLLLNLLILKLSFYSAGHKTFDKWLATELAWNSRSSLRTTSPTSHPSVIYIVCVMNCSWNIRICMEIRRWQSSRSMYWLFTK